MYTENLIKTMDAIIEQTVKYYKTDWTELDRNTAITLVLEGEPFVFIPRECGCYLVHSYQDAVTRDSIFNHYRDGDKELEDSKYYAVSPDGSSDPGKLFAGEIVRGIETAKIVYNFINNKEENNNV